jgi:oligopeptide/dipeptide ABC transporter ATP-binding protein
MILITHDLGVVAQICDKVAVMYAGEIIESGTVEDIFTDRPHHPYTVGLFGSIPNLEEETERLSPINGLMPDPTDLPKGCNFSPRCPHCMDICKEVEPGLYEADTPYLAESLAGGQYTEQFLLEQPLYPDQMVFLIGSFSMDKPEVEEGQCVAFSDSGKVMMRMDAKKAQVMAETLTAVVFVINHIKAAGHPLSTMGEAAKHFIANWESEKYRKSLAGKKG